MVAIRENGTITPRFYSHLFGESRQLPVRIFDLGLGSTEVGGQSSMGPLGVPGASLRAWKQIFHNAAVFGADIDRKTLFTEARIQTFFYDQTNPQSIRELWGQPALREGMDIIIDDGLHELPANQTFLDGSLQHLNAGGYYVVEDIDKPDFEKWKEQLPGYAIRFPEFDFALVALPAIRNITDNNLSILKRRT